MIRHDFSEIFDYITAHSCSYSINTNGTLITPKIAKLLKRKGRKMVALYGATQEVHDHITRTPGSFQAVMRGFAYLKEAGAGFVVQLIPMRDNYHQFQDMISLSESLSKHYRIGASWFYLSASGNAEVNKEIIHQRLSPEEAFELDKPDLSCEEAIGDANGQRSCGFGENDYLFSSCIAARRDFHIDPYAKMTFCCFVKDPAMRYDLRKGDFKEGWEKFIPSLAKKVKATEEYKKNCGSCVDRASCRFCPAYGYLEHRNFNKRIGYLCALAKENKKYREEWRRKHRRFYKIAGITIQVDADLPITGKTFHKKFKLFEAASANGDLVNIRHHFSLPELKDKDLGHEVYRKPPWAVYKKGDSWIYLGISPDPHDKSLHRAVVFNSDHTRARIYNDGEGAFKKGNLHSLTLFPTDQILLARLLADREGCYLHSCGVNFKGQGLLFVGHSEAGKSTMAMMLKGKAEILCDDRMIIRKQPLTAHRSPLSEFRIYGTWSHGDVPEVSAGSAPLRAILFLEKAKENQLIPVQDKKEIIRRLLAVLIRPFVTSVWWDKTLSFLDEMITEVPCYVLKFDKSGKVVELLEQRYKSDSKGGPIYPKRNGKGQG